MATKRELAAEALTLGERLGVEADVERKNHAQLTELVEGLRARVEATSQVDAEPQVAEDSALEPEAEPEPEAPAPSEPPVTSAPVVEEPLAPPQVAPESPQEPASPRVCKVAPGKALTSLRGILGPGTVVSASDFAGGQANLEELLAKGHLVRS